MSASPCAPRPGLVASGVVCLLLAWAVSGCAARSVPRAVPQPAPAAPSEQAPAAQQAGPTEDDVDAEFQPDRPSVANGAHIVPVGVVQLEAGGQWQRADAADRSAGTPLSVRIGVRDWLEARVETDGLSYQSDPTGSVTTFDDVQLGAKVRLWTSRDCRTSLAVLPEVDVGTRAGVGTDYSVTAIGSSDLTDAWHMDANYTLTVQGSEGLPVQHQVALSVSRPLAGKLGAYGEVSWQSSQESGAPHVVAIDGGLAYTLTWRVAFDVGVAVSSAGGGERPQLFGGLSVLVGELTRGRVLRDRMREAAVRRRSPRT